MQWSILGNYFLLPSKYYCRDLYLVRNISTKDTNSNFLLSKLLTYKYYTQSMNCNLQHNSNKSGSIKRNWRPVCMSQNLNFVSNI